MTSIAIYFEDKKLLPPVEEVLVEVLKSYPQIDDVEQWNEKTDRTKPVLILGRAPEVLPITYIKTLSQKQILSNPAAITELKAGLDNLLAPPDWPDVPYKVVDSLTAMEERQLGKALVIDIETGGTVQSDLPEHWWLLSMAIYDGKNCYVFTEEALSDGPGNARAQVLRILKSHKLIAHNMKFDFRSLSEHLGEKIYGHLDTMLLHHAINPGGKEHGLKDTAAKYVNAPDWEASIKEYLKDRTRGYEQIPRDVLYEYNALDVIWTWRLYKYLAKAAEGEERIAKLAKREFWMGNFYQDVENNGATVDLEHLQSLEDQFKAEVADVKGRLEDRSWEGFNPNSHVQVKKWFADHGYPLKSSDEKNIEKLLAKNPGDIVEGFAEELLEFRGINKLLTTYVNGIRKRLYFDNHVYPTLLVHGTNTGRLSSRNPNIQNIPRDKRLRKLFISRDPETRVVLNVDYSQAELRVMACLSDDENLISLFQPGAGDFFDNMMPSSFPRIDLDSISKEERKELRTSLKTVVYGLAYNRKAAAIAAELGISVFDAQQIITNFFKANPDFYEWRQWVEAMAVDPDGILVSPYGRYYQAEVVTNSNKQNVINSGLAFLPQSTASDMCVDAAVASHQWLHEYDAFIWATVHDSIMMDVPKVHVEEVAARVQAEMKASGQAVFGDKVAFDTEASWGYSWGEAD